MPPMALNDVNNRIPVTIGMRRIPNAVMVLAQAHPASAWVIVPNTLLPTVGAPSAATRCATSTNAHHRGMEHVKNSAAK